MVLRTLGGLALDDGSFTRPKPLLLLTYLALEGPQDRRFLAGLFWPDASDPMKSLGVALARLRRGVPGAVEADARRARARVEVDAGAFLRALERGDAERALALYEGPFLAGTHVPGRGVELEEWVLRTRELLAGRACRAAIEVAEREAKAGSFAAAAERVASAYRVTDATVLEPEELVRLHAVLCAADHPRAVEVRAEGEGLGLELAGSGTEARRRLTGGRDVGGPGVLRERGTRFVGRELERSDVASLLARPDVRLVTLAGPAGVGKTRLAIQVAREQRSLGAYAGGAHVVALEAVPDPQHVPSAIAEALGVELRGEGDPLAAVSARLADEPTLLVIDDVEHLMGAAATLGELARRCPEATLLVTSRERLNVEEEHVFPVGGLAFPGEDVPLETARRFDAVELFVQRAARSRPGFALDEANLPDVVQVCRAVEGLPLALELAATWVRVMPCREVAAELERNLDLLESRARDAPPRHRSLRGAFEPSWRLLTPRQRDVLASLAACRGGFGREAASHVAGATLADLASLVDRSLLRVGRDWRYERHPLVYRLTREKLAADPAREAGALERHATYFGGLLRTQAEYLTSGGPRQAEALRVIDAELENVRAAWRWLARHGRVGQIEEGVEPLHVFFENTGRFREGVDLLQDAADALDPPQHEGARAALGALLAKQALLHYRLGELERADALAKRGLASLPDGRTAARQHGLNLRALVAWRRGDADRAEALWEAALALGREGGSDAPVHPYLHNLALVHRTRGDYERAVAALQEALVRTRERDDRLNMVRVLNSLADLDLLRGRPWDAEAHLEEALAMADALGAEDSLPLIRLNLALAAHDAGQPERAAERAEEALEVIRDLPSADLAVGAWALVGRTASVRGRPDRAEEAFREAVRLMPKAGFLSVVLKALGWLAEFEIERGRAERSVPLLRQVALHHATEPDDRQRAERLLEETRQCIAAEPWMRALERGEAMSLDEAVNELARDAAWARSS